MAQISMPAIPMKMYRHFAVVTLLLTGALAMFANDNAQKQAPAVAENGAASPDMDSNERDEPAENQVVIQGASANSGGGGGPAYGSAQITRRSGGSTAYLDDEVYNDSFGQPMDDSASAGMSSSINPYARPAIPGYSQAYLETLTEEQRQALQAQMQAASQQSPAERRQQADLLQSSMRRRSAAGGSAE